MSVQDQIPEPFVLLKVAAQKAWDQYGGTWEGCPYCMQYSQAEGCGAGKLYQCPEIRKALKRIPYQLYLDAGGVEP